jgi:hypothetical protein
MNADLMGIRNTDKCLKNRLKNFRFLVEGFKITKIFAKTCGNETVHINNNFSQNFRENKTFLQNLLRKPSRAQKLFAKTVAKTITSRCEIWRKVHEFSLFTKMKKGVFVSSLVDSLAV